MQPRTRKSNAAAGQSVWLMYVGAAFLAVGILMWRVATTPLGAGGDTDLPGLRFVAVIAAIAGAAIAATGAVRWSMERWSARATSTGRRVD